MPRLAVHDPKGSCTPKRPAPSLCTARVYGGRIPRSLVHTRSRAARQRPLQGGALHHRAFCVNFWIESLPGSFQCRVTGIDITPAFVNAARKLTALLGLEGQVTIDYGDGQSLPYADGVFDGAYTQHVTMNVADRARFFSEAYRVLKPGAYFALTEHGLGTTGNLHHPAPWSNDGSGAYLIPPSETRAFLEAQ